MTKSVADLYGATQHVNRGELAHRIKVRTRPDGGAGAVVQLHDPVAGQADRTSRRKSSGWRANWPSRTKCRTCSSRRSVRPGAPGGAWRVPSRAHRQRRLLRFHSPARRQTDAGGGRHQRQRYFGGAADGHRARLRARLFAGAGAHPGLRRAGRRCVQGMRSAMYYRGNCAAIRTGPGLSDGDAELSALPQHAAGEVRHHVPGLLRCASRVADLLQRRTFASLRLGATMAQSSAWKLPAPWSACSTA